MNPIAYCVEEVERQGHAIHTLDGIVRVGWMINAWAYALGQQPVRDGIRMLTMIDIVMIGKKVEQDKNHRGIRTVGVRVGSRICPPPSEVEPLLHLLLTRIDKLNPLEFYRELLEIHPFVDGNGRTGKIVLNWLNGTLLNPIFPPNDFWGHPIRNP